jgi:hypothetical protein
MSAELVDPFAPQPTWTDQALDEMVSSIRYQLAHARWDDPNLLPDLVHKTLHELREKAAGDPWAATLLEALWHRAESRVPFAWTDDPQDLWPDPEPLMRRVHDAVEDL